MFLTLVSSDSKRLWETSAEGSLVQKGDLCFRADFDVRSLMACDLGFERALTQVQRALELRFSATGREEPEIELALV